MAECKFDKKLMEKALYNECNEVELNKFNSHIKSCEECASEYKALSEIIKVSSERIIDEKDEAFLENFWDNLEPELNKPKKSLQLSKLIDFIKGIGFSRIYNILPNNTVKQLSYGVAILIVGVFIGRFFLTSDSMEIYETTNQQSELNVVEARAERYINRSKVLLLGIMNFDPESNDYETLSLPHQKNISEELVIQAAELKEELKSPNQRHLKKLISDLEIILLQIANLEANQDVDGIELVKNGIDSKGIFLKINLHKMLKSDNSINSTQNKNEKNI